VLIETLFFFSSSSELRNIFLPRILTNHTFATYWLLSFGYGGTEVLTAVVISSAIFRNIRRLVR
jgi:hypothetical protein